MRIQSLLGLLLVGGMACEQPSRPEDTVSCGEGTEEKNGACRSTLGCGEGTRLEGESCVATGEEVPFIRCGEGTELEGDTCVATGEDPSLRCGAGTVLEGSECVSVFSPLLCGEGTAYRGGSCVVSPFGPGEVQDFLAEEQTGLFDDRGVETYDYRMLYTDLDSFQAEYYVSRDEPPQGGPFDALIIQFGPKATAYPESGGAWDFEFESFDCTQGALPSTPGSGTKARAAFVRGLGSAMETVICAESGRITLRESAFAVFEATLSAELSDGTTLENVRFEAGLSFL